MLIDVAPFAFASGVSVIVHDGYVPDFVIVAPDTNTLFVLVMTTPVVLVHAIALSTSVSVYVTHVLVSSKIVLLLIAAITGASLTQF